MFSLYSLSPRSSSAFSCRLRKRRPFMIAVAACAASVFRTSTSSLLSGSRPSLRPTPRTAITSPFTRQGKSQARPEAASSGARRARRRRRRAGPRTSRARSGAPRRDARPALAGAGHAAGAERREVAARAGQEEGHLAQAERGADPLEQPLARALEVEVGVQVLGEPHERLARAVALLVEEPVERLLDPRLDRREEQHHHERAQERDERRVRLLPAARR